MIPKQDDGYNHAPNEAGICELVKFAGDKK